MNVDFKVFTLFFRDFLMQTFALEEVDVSLSKK